MRRGLAGGAQERIGNSAGFDAMNVDKVLAVLSQLYREFSGHCNRNRAAFFTANVCELRELATDAYAIIAAANSSKRERIIFGIG